MYVAEEEDTNYYEFANANDENDESSYATAEHDVKEEEDEDVENDEDENRTHIFRVKERQLRKVIVKYSPHAINEVNITKLIHESIPYYSNFVTLLIERDILHLSQLKDNIVQKLNATAADDIDARYYIFKYDDVNAVDFADYLYSATSCKKLIVDMITSFTHLLYTLHLLNTAGICYFNLTYQNILFLEEYREKPVLKNFRLSLISKQLVQDHNYISHILHEIDNFTFQPIEVHLLYYFVTHKMVSITYTFIEEFCTQYINSSTILQLFPESYRASYKTQCMSLMMPYINKPRKVIMDNLLERNSTWDIYGLSVLYMHIFNAITTVFALKGTALNKITVELAKNLHPDASKRMSLEYTLTTFNRLLAEQPDWSFVNLLPNSKLDTLFEVLAK